MVSSTVYRRAAIFSAAAWVLLFTVYVSLAQVSIPDTSARILREGRSLTRIYKVRDYFPTRDVTLDVLIGRRSFDAHFALDYKFFFSPEDCTKLESIAIGKSIVPIEGRTRDSSADVKLSESFTVPATTAHPNLLFTPTADAVALSSMVFRDTTPMPLRVRWDSMTSTLEIWPDSLHWRKSHHGAKIPGFISPLVSITISKEGTPTVFFPELSASPSPLLNVRLALLTFLVPPAVLIAGLLAATYILLSTLDVMLIHFSRLIGMIVTLFLVLGLAVWICSGAPTIPLREATTLLTDTLRSTDEQLPQYSPPLEGGEAEKGLRGDEKA